MKAISIFRRVCGLLVIALLSCGALSPLQVQAREGGNLESSENFSREELAQMLAPIALYPDALLSQILMASTYPIELVEADRWVRRNPRLKGNTLDAALLDKDWDPSVKAVCHFPSVLSLMSERITQTTHLGNAFLAQEADVMDVVQELRAKAHSEGNLTTTSEQKVIVERETIIIQPANPRVVYVPYFNPYYAYGRWRYPRYPPYYWGPPGVSIRVGISYWPGIYFGFTYGSWSYFNWPRRYIYIDASRRPRFVRHKRWIARPGRWHHAPRHRRGVAYRDKFTARRYGQSPKRSRVYRRDIRGFPEHTDRHLRSHDRTRIEREKRRVDRGRPGRTRQERERAERKRKARERAFGNTQKRQGTARGAQQRKRAEGKRKARERAFGNTQKRQGTARGAQQRKRAEGKRKARERGFGTTQKRQGTARGAQQRKRAEGKRKARERGFGTTQKRRGTARSAQERQRAEGKRKARTRGFGNTQKRQRPDRERRARTSTGGSKATQRGRSTERRQDNVFNQVGNARKERQSSKRGRTSRQNPNAGSTNRSRSNRTGRHGRKRGKQ